MHSAVLSCELQTLGDTAKVLHEVAEHVTIKHEHLSVTVVMKSHLVSGSNIGDCRGCSLSPYKFSFQKLVLSQTHGLGL